MSYTSAQFIPHANGGCHIPNYWAAAQILLPDVDSSHAVPMPGEPTALVGAAKHAPHYPALAQMPTHWASPTGSVLILQSNHHATSLGFVGEFVAHTAKRPLVDFLVVGRADIIPLPDIPDIANHHRLHALPIQRGNKARGAFVFDISDLVPEFPQLLVLRSDEPSALAGAPLASTDLLVQVLDELIAILPPGAQESPIENMGRRSIVRDGHMDFAEINACRLVTLWLQNRLCLVGGDGFILRASPVNDDGLRESPGPIQDKRLVALPVGQAKHTIVEAHGTPLVLDPKEPLSLMGRSGIRLGFAPLPPTRKTGKERLDTGIGSMRMEPGAGVETHEVFWFEPDARMPDRAPEEDEGL